MYRTLLHVNFLMPALLIVIMVNPLCKSLLVPTVLSQQVFLLIKVLVVIVACALRATSFREEMQFHFSESFFLLHRILQDKNAQLFKYIKLRIQENFLSTFYTAFQQLCHFMIPTLLTLMYVFKLLQYLSEVQETNGATLPTDANGNVKIF